MQGRRRLPPRRLLSRRLPYRRLLYRRLPPKETTVEETTVQETTDSETSDPREVSIYKEEPPDLYPEEKTVPEAGEDFPAYNQVLKNPSRKNPSRVGWKKKPAKSGGYGKSYWQAKSGKARPVDYKVRIPETDVYSVFAWWPRAVGKQAKAKFGVRTTSGKKWSEVDQTRDGGYWVPIGEYEMKKGNRVSVQIKPGDGGSGRPVAEAVAVVRGVYDYPPDPKSPAPLGPEDATNGRTASSEATFSGAAAAKGISRRKILNRANSHLGTPYKLGGLSVCKPYKWEDCSCFTRLVFKRWRTLPDSPSAQLRSRRMAKVPRVALRIGDLVFHDTTGDGRMGPYDHVSLYAGNGYVIHANSYYKYKKVHRQKMKWLKNYKTARRVQR